MGSLTLKRSVPILKTKLRPSFVSSNLLPRKHLLQLLPAPPEVRLILLHALAGAGKSSLLYDCLERGLLGGAFYSVSDEDRDPYIFHSYLLTALDEKYPGLAAPGWSYLDQSGSADWEALSTALVNSIMEFGSQVTLILDDYHTVQSVPQIAATILKLVRHGPTNFKLVLSTRERPPLPLSNLLAKGLLLELRPQDLRFSEEEIIDFFRQGWNLELDAETAQALMHRTEGWVTGLQLTAQALGGRSKEAARAYIENLQGHDDGVYQYIATEVYETQPPDVQYFLLATSIVESFSPDLARHLSGNSSPLVMLDYLDRTRLFLVHLDNRGEWFRYHHLFRDFLRRRLAESSDLLDSATLHLKAGQWCLDKQDSTTAIGHFLKSNQVTKAAELLEQEGERMLQGGLHATFRAHLAKLPPKMLEDRPGLWLHVADLQEIDGNWSVAIAGYHRCLEAYRAAGAENEAAKVLEKLSLTYVKYGEIAQLLRVCEEGLQHCQETSLQALLSAWLGVALVSSGMDWERGYRLVTESHQLAQRSGSARAMSWTCMVYGFGYHLPRGNFTQSNRVLREGIHYFRKAGWLAVSIQLSMNLGLTNVVSGDYAVAQEVIESALLNAKESNITYLVRGLQIVQNIAYLEKRDFLQAQRTLDELVSAPIPVQMQPWFYRSQSLLLHFLGRMDESRTARQEMLASLELQGYGMYAPECLYALAYMLYREGQSHEARARVEQGLAISVAAQAKFWIMKGHQLLAAFELEVEENLRTCLEITHTNGYYSYWKADPWELSNRLLRLAQKQEMLNSGSPLLELLKPEPVAIPLPRAPLEIRALGALEIVRDQVPLLPGPYIRPRVLLLLKYFLTFPNRLLPAEQLIEQFWPSLPISQARTALNSHLTLVRKAVRLDAGEPSLISREGDGYRLSTDPLLYYDFRHFRELFETGRALSRNSQVAEAVELYKKAEKLYRGDFLSDDVYEEFIVLERRRLRHNYEQMLEYLGDYYSVRGSAEHAIECYIRALQGEEPKEGILQKLLHCCFAHGDTDTATREFDHFKSRIGDAGGLRLDRSTGALYRKVLKKNPPTPGLRSASQ